MLIYAEHHPMVNESTKAHYRTIRNLVDAVPVLDSDQMMELMSKPSLEHERIAFFAGFRLGAQLMLELSGELHTE